MVFAAVVIATCALCAVAALLAIGFYDERKPDTGKQLRGDRWGDD